MFETLYFSLFLTTLASHCNIDADISFISTFLSGTADVPDLLASISLRVPAHPTRNHSLFYVSVQSHPTTYGNDHSIHSFLHQFNKLFFVFLLTLIYTIYLMYFVSCVWDCKLYFIFYTRFHYIICYELYNLSNATWCKIK